MPNYMPPPMPEPGEGGKGNGNNLRFVMDVGSRRWQVVLLFTLLITGIAFVFGWVTHDDRKVYEYYGEVVVKPSLWEEVSGARRGLQVGTDTPKELVARTQMVNLAEEVTRQIVQQDIQNNGPWADVATAEALQAKTGVVHSALSITALDGPTPREGRIRITATAANPDDAQRFTEYATRVFVAQNQEAQLDHGEELHALIAEELEQLRGRLEAAQADEWNYRQAIGFRTRGKISEDMTRMNEELTVAEATKAEIRTKLEEIEGQMHQMHARLPKALGRVTDTVVTDLVDELDLLLQDKLTMGVRYQPAFPGMQALDADIQDKKQAILDAVNKLDEGLEGGSEVWADRLELRRQYNELQVELTSLEIRTATLERLLESLVANFDELNEQNFEYERLARETEQLQKQFNALFDREYELRTAMNRGPIHLERIDSGMAAPYLRPRQQGHALWVNSAVGALVGFLLGFGLAVMMEMMDTSIRTIEDVTEYVGLEVIGTIPQMRFGKGGRRNRARRRGTYVPAVDEDQIDACIVTQHDPKSPISESYRTLRTNFQLATIKEKPKTIMISSAVPGEGKTTTAVNLAVTMADSGMKVLVIDTDLRRPNVHRVLRMERGPGLSDVLREQIDVRSVVRATRIENLYVVSSGRVPPNPSELIGSERMQRLMKYFSEQYDIIICDAPSVLVVTDPVLLATQVDSVVLVISTDNATRETILRAKKHLDTAGAPLAGAVVNGLQASRRHYYYYYYYYDDGTRSKHPWYHT